MFRKVVAQNAGMLFEMFERGFQDEDCTESSLRLMAMRTTILGPIGKRNKLRGGDRLLDVEEQLKAAYKKEWCVRPP